MKHQITLAAAALLLTTVAQAGEKPGPYFELYGGYLNTDAQGVFSFGLNPAAATLPATSERTSDIDEGSFIGIALGAPINIGPFKAVEFYFERTAFQDGHDLVDYSAPGMGTIILPAADGSNEGGASGAGPAGFALLERSRYEAGTRYSLPRMAGLPFDAAFETFGGGGTENSISDLTGNLTLTGNMDWGFGGALLSATHRMPLSERVALVGRAAGGAYYYSADGFYETVGFVAGQATADADGIGFRGQLELSLETQVGSNLNVSIFGGLDYWSAMPTTVFPTTLTLVFPVTPTTIDTPDALEFRAGVKVRVGLE